MLMSLELEWDASEVLDLMADLSTCWAPLHPATSPLQGACFLFQGVYHCFLGSLEQVSAFVKQMSEEEPSSSEVQEFLLGALGYPATLDSCIGA